MITADTITDEQIRELRDAAYQRIERVRVLVDTKADRETHALCESALNEMCHPPRRREARARLAEILNARAR